ncbi:MAG: PKD domain-containing protein [Methanolinea sp.]|nr:PKD domain-containing protein [Methanolinea sp.]
MERESAISRNIILALAVSVAIIIVAVVMVLVFFPPQPDIVPSFNANIERSGNVVYLYHDGGDALQMSRTVVKINGQVIPSGALTFLHGQDWPWTPGKTMRIQYDGQGTPDLVQVLYSSGSREELLFSSQAAPAQETPIPISTLQPEVTTTSGTFSPVPTTSIATAAATMPVSSAPLGPQPPIPGFSATPRTGQFPLAVQFTDISMGGPTSWFWNFGDGSSSTERNPAHTYANPGVYSVTLTVTNSYGSGQKAEQDYIATGSIPVANFVATPSVGTSPLAVQFSDLSSGSPSSWEWDFGDGQASATRNPIHTYTASGSYTVTLTVHNAFGSQTRIQSNCVNVGVQNRLDAALIKSGAATLSDGYLQFLVTGSDGSIKIGGSTYRFAPQDNVQLFLDSGQIGEIDVNANGISSFKFDDVRMFVNGEFVRRGSVPNIRVPSYAGLKSTFILTIPPEDAGMVLYINGGRIIPASGLSVKLNQLTTNSAGQMSLLVKAGFAEYKGGTDSYVVE